MEFRGDDPDPGTEDDSWIQLPSPEDVATKLMPTEAFSDAKKICKVLLQAKSSQEIKDNYFSLFLPFSGMLGAQLIQPRLTMKIYS